MAKEVKQIVKIHLEGGKANPAGVGTVLGPTGINMGEFCQRFNEETKTRQEIVPTVITIYDDRSYDYILKEAPAARLVLAAAGIPKGSAVPHTDKVASITREQLKEITTRKLPDLNTIDLEQGMKTMAGTARSMGITIEGDDANEKTS